MAQTPFSSLNLFPSTSNIAAPTQQQLSSFSVQQLNYAPPSNVPRPRANSTAFRQLAHKSAHHLHSIPPREKSTRSLIIDYILWVHGRTRFAQARAELGMTDRTGGPNSKNYNHRFRPENFEEEGEQPSDGESFTVLQGERGTLSDPSGTDEDRIRRQDLTLAKALKQRSESLEKVVASILDQPPVVHPRQEDDLAGSQTSRPDPISSHPHTLPNGVRLRLALGTVINDVFARQNPPLSPRQQEPRNSPPTLRPSDSPLLSNSMILSDTAPLTLQFAPLPPCLVPLSSVSGASIAGTRSLSFSDVSSIGGSMFPDIVPTSQARALYAAGAFPFPSSSLLPPPPPVPRCPRHLRPGCNLCSVSSVSEAQRDRASTSTGGISGWLDGAGVGSGLAQTVESVLRRNARTNAEGTALTEMLPRFLRLSALIATELGSEEEMGITEREREWGVETDDERADKEQGHTSIVYPESTRTNSSGTSISNAGSVRSRASPYVLRPTREWYLLLAGLLTRAALEGYMIDGWKGTELLECLLMVGQGFGDVDIGDQEERNDQSKDGGDGQAKNDYSEFDPDETPTLRSAMRVLFPSLRQPKDLPNREKDGFEAEFQLEMEERLRKFYDVSPSALDLSAHLEELSWKYPAEPVERAALRLFEAVAQWRGKPELGTYKKKPPRPAVPSSLAANTNTTSMTIDALVHSNPSSPVAVQPHVSPTPAVPKLRRLSMQTYFTHQQQPQPSLGSASKQMRRPEVGIFGNGHMNRI